LLADGQWHSGERLADRLQITRTAVWQQVRALTALTGAIEAVPGRGYRLHSAVELLDARRIRSAIDPEFRPLLRRLEAHFTTDSTNQRLLENTARDGIHGHAVLAEYQTAGRGRQGRDWIAPLGAGLCLSLGWRFERPAQALTGLSLAAGVMLRQALTQAGVTDLQLKWPNDLMHKERKLAGLLIEMRGEMAGACTVVLGVGVNVALPPAAAARIKQPCTDLRTALGGKLPSRNALAARILSAWLAMLQGYSRTGFAPYQAAWRQADMLCGRTIILHSAEGTIHGRALEVAEDGALVVSVLSRPRRFYSGEVSLQKPA
jgi:BirA family biotin operon repressor/biotin-[acetyl-CoA-carboxylase] ligase